MNNHNETQSQADRLAMNRHNTSLSTIVPVPARPVVTILLGQYCYPTTTTTATLQVAKYRVWLLLVLVAFSGSPPADLCGYVSIPVPVPVAVSVRRIGVLGRRVLPAVRL